MPPATQGFITEEHKLGNQLNVMINKVHRQHWVIGYRYGDACTPEERDNDAALTAAITKALQIWLQPLRDYTQRPLVNDFRYRLSADRNAVRPRHHLLLQTRFIGGINERPCVTAYPHVQRHAGGSDLYWSPRA